MDRSTRPTPGLPLAPLSGVALVIALAAAAGPSAQTSAQPAAQLVLQSDPRAPGHAILFRGVRVFDGQRVIPATDVLVESGSIARVAAGQKPPAGAEVIDGAGKDPAAGIHRRPHARVPGFAGRSDRVRGHDRAGHVCVDVTYLRDVKAREARGSVTGAADLRSAGTLVTAPGGHGTEYGLEDPDALRPESAQAFVDARIAEGSDYIKIVYDDGKTYAMNLPTLDAATLKATIDAHVFQKVWSWFLGR